MSDQEVLVGKRRINRLNLDSDQQARQQAEEQERQDEIRQKKDEKRRRREEEARKVEEEHLKQEELQRHYKDPHTMLEPDSDSNNTFERAEKKIKKVFPDFKHSRQQNHHKRRHASESEESEGSGSEEEDSSESEEESSEAPKQKKEKKVAKKERKQQKREESEQLRASRPRVEKVKVEQKDPKQLLVGDVAVRWWYCLPEWPPADFDYEAELKKQGYRLVDNSRFRMEQNLVNGLFKATPIDGFVGVFKSKLKIIDVRPKENCPTLQFLRNKSMEELTNLLRTALKEQINSLNSQKYQGSQDLELITKLTRRLNQITV